MKMIHNTLNTHNYYILIHSYMYESHSMMADSEIGRWMPRGPEIRSTSIQQAAVFTYLYFQVNIFPLIPSSPGDLEWIIIKQSYFVM